MSVPPFHAAREPSCAPALLGLAATAFALSLAGSLLHAEPLACPAATRPASNDGKGKQADVRIEYCLDARNRLEGPRRLVRIHDGAVTSDEWFHDGKRQGPSHVYLEGTPIEVDMYVDDKVVSSRYTIEGLRLMVAEANTLAKQEDGTYSISILDDRVLQVDEMTPWPWAAFVFAIDEDRLGQHFAGQSAVCGMFSDPIYDIDRLHVRYLTPDGGVLRHFEFGREICSPGLAR
jgi:hypothetical protein